MNYQETLIEDPLYRLATGAALPSMVPTEVLAQRLVMEANEGNEAVLIWLDALIDNGPTLDLLKQLSAAVFEVDIPQYLTLDLDTRKFRFALRGRMTKKAAERFRHAGPALAIVRLVNEDFTDRLRRCELEECRRYFVGDPRSRWCSNACGSKYRQKEYRKRKRRQ